MTRTRFQQEMEELREKLLRMGGMAELAVDRACQAYIDRDLARCHLVLEGESLINAAEREIDEVANRGNVTIHVIDPRPLGSVAFGGDTVLRRLAADTGGRAILNTNAPIEQLQGVIAEKSRALAPGSGGGREVIARVGRESAARRPASFSRARARRRRAARRPRAPRLPARAPRARPCVRRGRC